MRCVQTQSSFYCDQFLMGGLAFIIVLPALVLFSFSIITLIFSKWYKGTVSVAAKTIIIIFAAIIFLTPYILIFYPHGQIYTYQDYKNRVEQLRIKTEKDQEAQCAEYKLKYNIFGHEGETFPTPPPGCIPF